MESLAFDDIQNLHQGIQQIYTCHNLDTFPIDALRVVDRLVPSDWPLFCLTNTRTGQLFQTSLPSFSGLSPRLIEVLEKILSEDRQSHPIARNMPQTLHGSHKLSDFISQQELHSYEGLYQQFLRQLGVEDQMLFFLPDINPGRWSELAQTNTTLTGFILNRPSCSFVERDRQFAPSPLISSIFKCPKVSATESKCLQTSAIIRLSRDDRIEYRRAGNLDRPTSNKLARNLLCEI